MMFILVRAMQKNGASTLIPKLYCVVGMIFGNFTLLALFTGTLLQAFSKTIQEHQSIGQDQVDFDDFWKKFEQKDKRDMLSRKCLCSAIVSLYRTFQLEFKDLDAKEAADAKDDD